MKRMISLLLVFVIMSSSIRSLAEDIYLYPRLEFVLRMSDKMEKEFREWAYSKLEEYYQYLNNTEIQHVFDEYYKIADFKNNYYDELLGTRESLYNQTVGHVFNTNEELAENRMTVKYTKDSITDTEKERAILEAILDSLEEMQATEPDFIEKYASKSDNRKYYTIGMNGELKENQYIKALDDESWNDFWNSMTNSIIDAVDVALTTYFAYTKAAPDDDLREMIQDIFANGAKQIAKEIHDEFIKRAENEIKNYCTQKIVNTMMDVRAAKIQAIKEIYIDTDFSDVDNKKYYRVAGYEDASIIIEQYKSVAGKIISYYENISDEQIKKDAKTAADEAMEQFDLYLLRELEGSDLVKLAVCDILEETIKSAIKYANKKLSEYLGQGSLNFKETSLLITCLNFLKSGLEAGLDYIEEIIRGGEYDLNEESLWSKINDDFNKNVLKQIGNPIEWIKDTVKSKNLRTKLKESIKNDYSFDKERVAMNEGYRQGILTRAKNHGNDGIVTGIVELAIYYCLVDVQAEYIDQMLDYIFDGKRPSNDEIWKAVEKSFKHNLSSFILDVMKMIADTDNVSANAITDYMNAEDLCSNENMEQLKKALEKYKKQATLLEVIAKTAEKAWKTGEDLAKVILDYDEAAKGEDATSKIANDIYMDMVSSKPLHLYIQEHYAQIYNLCDPSKVDISEIWELLAHLKKAVDYDAVGTNNYVNLVLRCSSESTPSNFTKLVNEGEVRLFNITKDWVTLVKKTYPTMHPLWDIFKFFYYEPKSYVLITADYYNIDNNRGLLSIDRATGIRDDAKWWKEDWYYEGWKDEWYTLN